MSPQLSSGEIVGLITLILNLLALVWGAAKLSSKLDALVEAFTKHVARVDDIADKAEKTQEKVAVLWDGHERRQGSIDRRQLPGT